jgi:hypothetical protein
MQDYCTSPCRYPWQPKWHTPDVTAEKTFAVSLHDVAPATLTKCAPLLALLAHHKVPATLLVVPEFHHASRADSDVVFIEAIHGLIARGHEAVLHGYYHLDSGPRTINPIKWLIRHWYTASEGEFSNLSQAVTKTLLRRGMESMRRMGTTPTGFVPPAWLLSRDAWRALRECGDLSYVGMREHLVPLPTGLAATGRRIHAPSLVYSTRSSWRRWTSRMWNSIRLARLRNHPRIRLALHPEDAAHPGVTAHWDRILEQLAVERRPCLESDWLRHC